MSVIIDGTNGVTTNSGTLISATTIGVGGTTPSTSGAGISFPATQSASSDANTLDDYEEGTWTVTDASSASLTFTYNTGRYVKVGGLVYVSADFSYPSTASGVIAKINLPFAALSQSGNAGSPGGGVAYYNGGGATTGAIGFYVSNGQSVANIYRLNTGGTSAINSDLSTREVAFTIVYPTA